MGGIYGVRVEGQVEILELEMLSNESDILKRVTRAKRAGASYGCLSYINLYICSALACDDILSILARAMKKDHA